MHFIFYNYVSGQVVDVVTGLTNPYSILTKQNTLYIAESNGNKISKIDITLSVDEVQKEKVKLFPNSSSRYLNVSGFAKNEKFRIISLTGKLILVGTLLEDNKIDLTGINSGVYFIKFSNGTVKKFVKQ
ncbi:T9SS type A sorting domain-containing protein [Kordia sp.]|uniref:T9SS type A sorting domain-containing protein n=1 Tax=Kordia sp. TaxID=1965332 RepID=UPI0025C21F18|nr:T9SS type A sorting domain-containing protein [Kordia sp.]MCH2195006.1 T9SS type A sorting domain-containing protein [Kordia sp.]